MVTIRPFRALRPNKDLYQAIVSLPYDVVTSDEVAEEISKNPYSFLRIIRPEVELKNNNPYSEEVYENAKKNLDEFISKDYLIQDDKPKLYVYSLEKANNKQIGFVACASVDDYDNDLIKKHEKTRPEKEDDRVKHIEKSRAHTGFVFLTYKAEKRLNEILDKIKKTEPEYDFTSDDNVHHTFWDIDNDELNNEIVNEFKKVPKLYVADGHHRSAAASRVYKNIKTKEAGYFLSIIFPHDSLNILAYNRVVKDLNGLTNEEFLNKLEKNFTLKEVAPNDEKTGYKPESQKTIGMYLYGKWYSLIPKHCIIDNDPVLSLDVSILQNYLLEPVLGIGDPRTDSRINFIGGVRGTEYLKKLVDSDKYAVAFSMYPTSIEQLMDVADANKLMPPKSTWFEPKPRSGFAIHLID